MVISCSAVGCTNRQGQKEGLSFYRFPANRNRRMEWVAALNRDPNWTPSNTSRICSEHFIAGRKDDNPQSPDYVPSVFNSTPSKKRKKNRRSKQKGVNAKHQKEENQTSLAADALLKLKGIQHDSISHEENGVFLPYADTTDLRAECQSLRREIVVLKTKLNARTFDEMSLRGNDMKVKDLTGLPSFSMLMAVVNHVKEYLPNTHMSPFQLVLTTCMRLRYSLDVQFLSYLFGGSGLSIARSFTDVVHVMERCLTSALVLWPEREQLRMSMPVSFQEMYQKCACIIERLEIVVDQARNLKPDSRIYTDSKPYNVVKYLVGMTLKGSICFVSKGWEGSISDVEITENCGILKHLSPGDVILADGRFQVGNSVELFNATLRMPAFKKGLDKLHPLDMEAIHALAMQKIYLERVVGLARQKYTLLQSTMPEAYMISDQHGLTTLDKIVRVACALTNLSESPMAFE